MQPHPSVPTSLQRLPAPSIGPHEHPVHRGTPTHQQSLLHVDSRLLPYAPMLPRRKFVWLHSCVLRDLQLQWQLALQKPPMPWLQGRGPQARHVPANPPICMQRLRQGQIVATPPPPQPGPLEPGPATTPRRVAHVPHWPCPSLQMQRSPLHGPRAMDVSSRPPPGQHPAGTATRPALRPRPVEPLLRCPSTRMQLQQRTANHPDPSGPMPMLLPLV
mmetsp:Transcript_130290/g.324910  ORF Transcript_130290/g.324910 Transcript_130290/m.324910 type:complete len:217 (-) Transcript_130290:370-1020(-)